MAKRTAAEEREAYSDATARDANTCQRCLRNCGPIARDHRQNRQASNTAVENLQLLGLACHIWKTEHPAAAIREGWAVPSWAVPSEFPAARWFPTTLGTVRLGWCLYGPDGSVNEISSEEAHARMEGRWA